MPTIVKSPNDERDYRFFVLENQLRCLVITDPDTDRSAISLDLKVGSSLDPMDLPGTSLFLERMLFRGNKKYGEEAEYN